MGLFKKKKKKKKKKKQNSVAPSAEARPGVATARATSSVISSAPSGMMMVEVYVDRADYDPAGIDAEIALANTVVANELDQGRHEYVPPALGDWFQANRGAQASPTELGLAWYVHQELGRLQLVDADFLAGAGLSDPAAHPGNNIWSNRVTAALVGTNVAHLIDHHNPGAISVGFAGEEVIPPELPWQSGMGVRSISGVDVAIRMPNPRTPWVVAVTGVTQVDAHFGFANGDEMGYLGAFPVFDSRQCASGNPARFAQVTLQQSEVIATSAGEYRVAANRALAAAVAQREAGLPEGLRGWLSSDEAQSGENPPEEFGARWRFHQNTGVMELVDRDLAALALSTSGYDIWGPGCWSQMGAAVESV